MKYFIIIVLILLSFISYSQDYLKISGTVQDAQTGERLHYVNVYLSNLNIGTITNNKGEYVLNVKINKLLDTLNFSYIGYSVAKLFIDENKDSFVFNVKLIQKSIEINTIKVVDKKINPVKILEKTYDFLKEHQSKTYKVDHYTRVNVKYNDRFIYGASGFFNGYIGNKLDLWHNSKLISREIKTNDSLLYSHKTPSVSFSAMNSSIPIKLISGLLKKGDIKIDTVFFYNESKMYVLSVNNNFKNTLPSNYDMIVNPDLTNIILNQINDKKEVYYKFYIEVKGDKYFLIKIEIVRNLSSKDFNFCFYKKEFYYKILDDNSVIPNYQNCFEAYVNDTAKYYIYNDYVITKYDTVNTVDESYTCIDYLFPIYDEITFRNNEKKNSEAKSEIIKAIQNNNNTNFNYIKQDTLEQIINKNFLYNKKH
jgi:hypothetical protein